MHAAIETLGIPRKNLLFLDFEYGSLGKHEKEAEERILDIMRKHPPDEVYFPHMEDYNPDHQKTNRIVKRGIQKTGLTPMKLKYSIIQKYARIAPLIERLVDPFRKRIVEIDI